MGEGKYDYVNPQHYRGGSVQPIDLIEKYNLDFSLGNAFKYICRAGQKPNEPILRDLEKAEWYITRYLANESKTLTGVLYIMGEKPNVIMDVIMEKHSELMNQTYETVSLLNIKDSTISEILYYILESHVYITSSQMRLEFVSHGLELLNQKILTTKE